uniref:AbLIM_anchor domain-containing protein n=1 Tax=Haemonchus contortus TaxID=6289 RepID=A0A7I4YJX7_HAECO
MAPMTALPDFGLNTDDIRYFKMDSYIQGKGPDRLKYLDLEGRWVLSGKSMPYISAAFNHLERLNDARVPFGDITEEPINALGMVGWTPSSQPTKVPEKRPAATFKTPIAVVLDDDVPPSPREVLPHRSAGYGLAHQKRKLHIPDRSRSVSPLRAESPLQSYDKYAKYERNRTDSMTRFGTQWSGAGHDSGFSSPQRSGNDWRPPHRTPSLSPRIPTPVQRPIEVYPHKEELRVMTRETKKGYIPYRSGGYGAYHEKRQYDLSPRSIGSAADYSSGGSEQSSPASSFERNADEILLMTYHSRKTVGTSPRRNRGNWIRY